MSGRHHRTYAYQRDARSVVAAAYADPLTQCGRCGGYAHHGDPWEAGHVIDGQVGGQLRAEHRSCNRAAGARLGNARRAARAGLATTRDWLA